MNEISNEENIALEKSIKEFGYLDSVPAISYDHVERKIISGNYVFPVIDIL